MLLLSPHSFKIINFRIDEFYLWTLSYLYLENRKVVKSILDFELYVTEALHQTHAVKPGERN
mgnify:FL=1